MRNYFFYFRFFIILLLAFMPFSTAVAQVPQQINFQGLLTDTSGNPVPDDDYEMTFAIYDTSSDGTRLWSEAKTVKVVNGIYNVILGKPGNGIDPIDMTGDRYLGISVSGDVEMTPRQLITSAVFSLRSALSDDANTLMGYTLTDLDARYIQPGETASINSNIIADASVMSEDICDGAVLTEILDDDGSGSGLDADRLDGKHASYFMSAATDKWVDMTGDTMTGTLNLPSDGLRVATNQLVVTGGRVGLGTAFPNEQLEITGNLRLPATTSSTGIIRSGSGTLIHRYGTGNFFAGLNAGNLMMTGNQNTGTRYNALRSNNEGEYNTAAGAFSLYLNSEGSYNTASGDNALYSNTTGSRNTAIGSNTLFSNITGNSNTAIGINALYSNTTGHDNAASGSNTLVSNTTGDYNTASGSNALYFNTTGYSNTANGGHALYSNVSGHDNTAIGSLSLRFNTTGDDNTAVGYEALYNNKTGYRNTAIGHNALGGNTSAIHGTALGWNAGASSIIGNGNTIIGCNADVSAGSLANATALGFGAVVNGSNRVRIGNTYVS